MKTPENKTGAKDPVLRHVRAENPYKDEPSFLRALEARIESSKTAKESLNFEGEIQFQEDINHATDPEQRLQLLWLAHETEPDSVHFMTQLAHELARQDKQLDLAEQLLKRVVLEERSFQSVIDLATFSQRRGNFEAALKLYDFLEAHKSKKEFKRVDSFQVTASKGYCLQKLGRFAAALELTEKGLIDEPDDLELSVRKVNCLQGLDRAPEALALIKSLIWHRPDNARLYLCYSSVLYREQRFKESEDALEKALTIDPNSSGAQKLHMLTLYTLGNYKEVSKVAERILTTSGLNEILLGVYAHSLLKENKYSECVELIEKYGQKYIEKNEHLLWMQAKAYGYLGKRLQAKQRLVRLLNLNPKSQYATAFVSLAKGTAGAEIEADGNELALLKTLEHIFGPERWKSIESHAQTFKWNISAEDLESEAYSRSVQNNFWSGLYDQAIDSNARTVTAFSHSDEYRTEKESKKHSSS